MWGEPATEECWKCYIPIEMESLAVLRVEGWGRTFKLQSPHKEITSVSIVWGEPKPETPSVCISTLNFSVINDFGLEWLWLGRIGVSIGTSPFEWF